jgi:transcriptional regulator with XRE-family HTH domain
MRANRKRYPKGTWMRLTSGQILRAFMDTKGLSNADIAAHARVGRTFISALVNERRTSCTPEVALRIAERLEVPLEVLFTPRPSAASGGSVSTRRKDAAA